MISTICKLSLTATLAIPIGLFAQNVAPANPTTPSATAPGTTIYVMGGGLYGSGGVYVTPSTSFASPAPATGVSLAGRAGISLNEPVYTGVQSTLQPTPFNYYYGSPISYGAASPTVGEEMAAESGPLIRDLLPSYSREAEAQARSMSVAEVAAQYKANRPQNVRTFSNTDAQRLAGNVAIGGSGVAGTIQPTAPPTTAPEPPAPNKQTMAANSTPPVAAKQPTQPATPSTATTRLPATSTLLPLLGLAGLLSGGLGLWLRGKLSR